MEKEKRSHPHKNRLFGPPHSPGAPHYMNFSIGDHMINAIKNYATQALEDLPGDLLFHNLEHTKQVVAAVWEIGSMSGLSTREIKIILAAAWFHDLGHKVKYMDHEEESVKLAHHFFTAQEVNPCLVQCIEACIHATKMPQQPKGLFQEVLCDADLYHLSTPACLENGKKLRKELHLKLGKVVDDECWDRTNLLFLKNHQYFTAYGKKILQPRKEKYAMHKLRRQIINRRSNREK